MLSSSRSAIKPKSISRRGVLALAFHHNCVLWNLSFQPVPAKEDGLSIRFAYLAVLRVSGWPAGPDLACLCKDHSMPTLIAGRNGS
jgi:hypothetical protein